MERSIPHTLSFGLNGGTVRAEGIRSVHEEYAFTVTENSIPVVRIRLPVVGRVHIYNALAAFAAARLSGFSPSEIKTGLESFRGVKRRFERVGTLCGVSVVCDYAHHPRELSAAISTANRLCMGRVHVVFQPHTYTRTRDFMAEFVSVLKGCERPVIYSTYSARENYFYAGSAAALVAKLPEARYAQSPTQLKRRLSENLARDDLVLVLGAGDIYDVAKSILD